MKSWIIHLLIKLGWIKPQSMTEAELNALLATNFPHYLMFNVVTTQGSLEISDAKLSMPVSSSELHIQFFCTLTVSLVGQQIYSADIIVHGKVLPYFLKSESAIRIKSFEISDIQLVNDKHAYISPIKDVIALFIPGPISLALSSTLNTSLSLLNGLVEQPLLSYLSLYAAGKKQQVIDFHQQDIIELISSEIEKSDWCYLLDLQNRDEAFFAQYGQTVQVKQGKLYFRF